MSGRVCVSAKSTVSVCFVALTMTPLSITRAGAINSGIEEISPPSETQPLATTPGVPFDIAFGVALTSDYVSRGITNSNSSPAI